MQAGPGVGEIDRHHIGPFPVKEAQAADPGAPFEEFVQDRFIGDFSVFLVAWPDSRWGRCGEAPRARPKGGKPLGRQRGFLGRPGRRPGASSTAYIKPHLGISLRAARSALHLLWVVHGRGRARPRRRRSALIRALPWPGPAWFPGWNCIGRSPAPREPTEGLMGTVGPRGGGMHGSPAAGKTCRPFASERP